MTLKYSDNLCSLSEIENGGIVTRYDEKLGDIMWIGIKITEERTLDIWLDFVRGEVRSVEFSPNCTYYAGQGIIS